MLTAGNQAENPNIFLITQLNYCKSELAHTFFLDTLLLAFFRRPFAIFVRFVAFGPDEVETSSFFFKVLNILLNFHLI